MQEHPAPPFEKHQAPDRQPFVRALLVAREDLGVYGLGTRRTLPDFAAFSGIDYAARTLGASAYLPRLP